MSQMNNSSANQMTITLRGRGKSQRPKPQKQTKPPIVVSSAASKARKAKHKPKRKGLLTTALDVAEGVASYLPGAIKGIRGMFSAKEASYATPSSFACIQNNVTQMEPSSRVTHPSLGIAGTRVYGSQPLSFIQLASGSPPGAFFRLDVTIPAIVSTNVIVMNPILLGGPLSVQGYLHDRYVFRMIRIKYTTYVTTTTLGVGAMCFEKDIASLTAQSFNGVRVVTPNVTFPYRIPKAELDYVYDGPDLFYCDQATVGLPVNLPQARQDVQSVLVGFDPTGIVPGTDPSFMGYLDIEYVIDFFDPVAPTALLGTTTKEILALRELRRQFALDHVPRILPMPESAAAAALDEAVQTIHNRLSTRKPDRPDESKELSFP
jgi:hypothetical protein